MTFSEKYKEELSDIRFAEKFEENTVILLTQQAAGGKDKNIMKKTVSKPTKILIAAILIFTVLSSTVFAVSKLLSADDVAQHFGDSQVSEAFDNQIFVVESVTDKGYTVSFLGLVKGEKFESKGIKADCSYFVVSIAASDGSALSIIDGNPLGMSVIIEGYPAWQINSWSLNTSANGMEEDGILYYLYDCENLEIFADKNVYLAVYDGMIPDIDTITMNTDGTFEFAEGYDGFKAMFSIPLDPEKADPDAANEILREYIYSEENDLKSETSQDSITIEEDDFIPESDMEPMANPKDKWKITN